MKVTHALHPRIDAVQRQLVHLEVFAVKLLERRAKVRLDRLRVEFGERQLLREKERIVDTTRRHPAYCLRNFP